jgi:flagellar biosynthesis/type III secretory pathway M-ring protein FliF/YscJ
MTVGLPLLGIGLACIMIVFALAIWYLMASMRSYEERRDHEEAQRMATQPWDSAGGRANR